MAAKEVLFRDEARPCASAQEVVVFEAVDSEALATLAINTVRSTLKTCAVKAPGFGERRKARLSDLGRARRVEIGTATEPELKERDPRRGRPAELRGLPAVGAEPEF
jgi:hypothetical protein